MCKKSWNSYMCLFTVSSLTDWQIVLLFKVQQSCIQWILLVINKLHNTIIQSSRFFSLCIYHESAIILQMTYTVVLVLSHNDDLCKHVFPQFYKQASVIKITIQVEYMNGDELQIIVITFVQKNIHEIDTKIYQIVIYCYQLCTISFSVTD